jgi:hypothetical protein
MVMEEGGRSREGMLLGSRVSPPVSPGATRRPQNSNLMMLISLMDELMVLKMW